MFDERFARLTKRINERLRDGNAWRDDERLIVFTEYKTTLDYLRARLEKEFKDSGTAIRVLFGDPSARDNRRDIIRAFNDPADPVRILIGTDVASEGINLQETARLLLHYDIPWNPARLEQRNGRLDRHGQARDVTVYHFTSDNDADLRFCARVAEKVNEIREDLGSVEEVLDSAFERHFHRMEDTDSALNEMDSAVNEARGRASIPSDHSRVDGSSEVEQLDMLRGELDLSPDTLRSTLEVALGVNSLLGPDGRGRFQMPLLPHWRTLIDETLRIGESGAVRGVIFNAKLFVEQVRNRPVFRPMKDTVLLHLGHPLFRQALATFARKRYGGKDEAVSRWSVRRGKVPPGCEALILLTVEELAANELRQPFHHWVRTLRIPVRNGELSPMLQPVAAAGDDPTSVASADDENRARDLWLELERDISKVRDEHSGVCTAEARERLRAAQVIATKNERDRFRFRKAEIKKQLTERSLDRLRKEIEQINKQRQQLHLDPEENASMAAKQFDLEQELQRRTHHDNELLQFLEREETRVLEKVLPQQYSLRGEVQVLPVAIEIRFPEVIQ